MGLAAVVSFEKFQQERSQADRRIKMHQALDQWLDDIENQMKVPKPKLVQITEAVFQGRQNLTQTITQGLIESRYQQEQEREFYQCPECRKVLTARETPARRVETMVGEISLKRPYFYCVSCQKGCYPLDDALDLSSRRKQDDLQQAVVKLTKEVP